MPAFFPGPSRNRQLHPFRGHVSRAISRCGNFRIGRHGRKLLRKLFFIRVIDVDALRIRQHLHYSRTDVTEWLIGAGYSQGHRIKDQVSEPRSHGPLVAEDPLKYGLHGFKIEKRLVEVKGRSEEDRPFD